MVLLTASTDFFDRCDLNIQISDYFLIFDNKKTHHLFDLITNMQGCGAAVRMVGPGCRRWLSHDTPTIITRGLHAGEGGEGKRLSHVTPGNLPTMVDVSNKVVTTRTAHARSVINLPPDVVAGLIPLDSEGTDIKGPKGAVFATAIVAGVLGAKKTSELIPFCHPLPIEKCSINIVLEKNDVIVDCEVKVSHKTGVEMEALVGASVASLW
jgi:cyclic pyranopterin phosphate synthase